MSILIVGDRSQVEGPLKSLPFAQAIQRLDSEGNTVAPPATGIKPAAARASAN
jgi:hypothetical protein